jgi:death-on-curing protein
MTLWLEQRLVVAIHEIQLSQHGGGVGLRDPGLLESALARPLNRAGYGEPDIAELAALYAIGIVKNHPFIDGNKRTGFAALMTFLELNGLDFDPPDVEAVMTMLALAGGDIGEDVFIAWVKRHAQPRG